MLSSSIIESNLNGSSIIFPSITIPKGELLLLKGKSGSGKSTFLHSVAGLVPLLRGNIKIEGHGEISKNIVPKNWRKNALTIIPQRPLFWQSLTVEENIKLSEWSKDIESENIEYILEKLGIIDLSKKAVNKLSLGQQQRLSAARALISKVPVVLADEPTAALDEENTNTLINLFKEHQSETGCSILVSSHDNRLDSIADQIVIL
ncbi:ATP-binding cassette domain-containing protein [Schleiferiaceae bacterium]|jgi:ABC-type lipoprotein export system ATPase subunit|nr:ATP-binding cassette domain-containing protein [Schleiferiaceae bacterium]